MYGVEKFKLSGHDLYVVVDHDSGVSTEQWVDRVSRCLKFFDRLFMETGCWYARDSTRVFWGSLFNDEKEELVRKVGLEPKELLPFLADPNVQPFNEGNVYFDFVYESVFRVVFSGSVDVPASSRYGNQLRITFRSYNDEDPLVNDVTLVGKVFYALILILQPSYMGFYPSSLPEYFYWQGKEVPFGAEIIYLNDPHAAELVPEGVRRFGDGTIISWLPRDFFLDEQLQQHTEYLENHGIHGPEQPIWKR